MNCKEARRQFLEVLAEGTVGSPVSEHLCSCGSCSQEWQALQGTMSLLNEWEAPVDVSPYFMTRLRARVAEEESAESRGWLAWVRQPVLAATMAIIMIAVGGLGMLRLGGTPQKRQAAEIHARKGSAVGDLQYLDGNNDLLANFELLDDVSSQNK